MTADALTRPLPPSAYADERTPIGDESWLRTTLAVIFADLRGIVAECPTCGAAGSRPCREDGRFVKRHGRRA